jgi:hypothetical protein
VKENYDDPCTWKGADDPFIFEVWQRGGHCVGTQRQDFDREQLDRFAVNHHFRTSFGWFTIVSDDNIISLQHAIFFAKAFCLGNVVRYRCDLKGVSR